jgi:Uncharacterized conserved protein
VEKVYAPKIFVLGIDGMDPRLTKKYLNQGKMPNIKRFIEKGSAREDLKMLGGQPTGTPPMWTTLATGCNPNVHGITCFNRASQKGLDYTDYNLDSRNCHAEPLWNVFAENGKKTLVWHWPGSSWPPTSTSQNLHVIDGSQPTAINLGVAEVDREFFLIANETIEEVTFKARGITDGVVPCAIADLDVADVPDSDDGELSLPEQTALGIAGKDSAARHFIMSEKDGTGAISDTPFDVSLSPIQPAQGWANAPEGAKEITLLFSGGLVRRPALILKNEDGIYDQIAIYVNKKSEEPLCLLKKGEFTLSVVDEAYKNNIKYMAARNLCLLEINEDGSYAKIYASGAMDINNDKVFHPKRLYKSITQNVGYVPAGSMMGACERQSISDCMKRQWDYNCQWQAAALNYLIVSEEYDVVFSHNHNVDAQLHMFVKFLKERENYKLTEADYAEFLEDVYIQTDNYIGEFLHLLNEGWTVFLVSDHALICPEYDPPLIGDVAGVNVGLMRELGLTVMLKDENGEDKKAIDWPRTVAVASRGNHIYINLKGRDEFGFVDPADQYQVEEEIMTKLYGYKDPKTGQRVIQMALRNKDAVLLGMGGPECGDIIYWVAQGYNYDHFDGLSTAEGYADTSLSPIFIAAGPGIKAGFMTDRIIRQVDLAPTMAILGGIRMPKQCEGAPIYQIMDCGDLFE